MAAKKGFVFEKEFQLDGRKIVVGCSSGSQRGFVQMFNPQSWNFITISVHIDGTIEVTTCKTFPSSRIDVVETSTHRKGRYDEVKLKVTI